MTLHISFNKRRLLANKGLVNRTGVREANSVRQHHAPDVIQYPLPYLPHRQETIALGRPGKNEQFQAYVTSFINKKHRYYSSNLTYFDKTHINTAGQKIMCASADNN